MHTIRNVALIGLGALGCAYAGKLYDRDPAALRVITSEDRARRYREQGFWINGKAYGFQYAAHSGGVTADLILVVVKTHQLPQAIEDMSSFVGPDTVIMSLMNGITSEELLGEAFGMEKMLYAVSYGLTANREGNHIRFPSYGTITFGEKNDSLSPRVQAVKALFDNSGIPSNIPENILRSLWWKFMVNVGINQCSAVTRGRFGLFQTDKDAQGLMESAMREVIALSKQAGINLSEADIGKWYDILLTLDPASRTSMLEDIQSGRPTEVESFGGAVCQLGQRYGVATPVNEALLRQIRVIERNSDFVS